MRSPSPVVRGDGGGYVASRQPPSQRGLSSSPSSSSGSFRSPRSRGSGVASTSGHDPLSSRAFQRTAEAAAHPGTVPAGSGEEGGVSNRARERTVSVIRDTQRGGGHGDWCAAMSSREGMRTRERG